MFATEIIEFELSFTDQQLYNIQNYEENGLIDKEKIPRFQLYSFSTKTSPFGLNGPFSENAPTPREEQPGPAKDPLRNKFQEPRITSNIDVGKSEPHLHSAREPKA